MPLVFSDNVEPGFTSYPQPAPEPAPGPGFFENGGALDAGFYLENDVANVFELMNKPAFNEDPQYDLAGDLKAKGLWEHRDSYLGSRSAGQTDYITGKIAKEQQAKETLASAGMGGIAATIAAGLMSPTIFIPLIGPEARGLRALGEGALFASIGAGLQEAPLWANQETRTGEEVAFSFGAQTILGGILGGAVGFMGKGKFEKAASDMADPQGGKYGSSLIPNSTEPSSVAGFIPAPVSAEAASFKAAGGLKSSVLGLSDRLARIGPVTRGIAQDVSEQYRYYMSRFSSAGVTMEDNVHGIAASPGGNVENLIKGHYPKLASTVETADQLYADYFFGNTTRMLGRNIRATLAGYMQKSKMTKDQFFDAAGRALFDPVPSAIPEVQKLVDHVRSQVFDPTLKEAIETGIYKGEQEVLDAIMNDPVYASRLWVASKINKRRGELVDKFTNHVNQKLQNQFSAAYDKLISSNKNAKELIDDLSLDDDLAASLKAKWTEDLATLEKASPEHLKVLEEDIAAARAERSSIDREAPFVKEEGGQRLSGRDVRAQLEREIEQLTRLGGDALPKMREVRKNIQRRLKNLSRSRAVLTAKQQAKLDRIEALEDASLNTMNRAIRAAQRFIDGIESFTEPEFKRQVKKVRNLLTDVVKKFNKTEERLQKMQADSDTDKTLSSLVNQDKRAGKIDDLINQLEDMQSLSKEDRAGWREGIQAGLDQMLEKYNEINLRRGARRERLREQAKALDPAQVEPRIAEIKRQMVEREGKLANDNRFKDGRVNLETGVADFREAAREIAVDIVTRLTSTDRRLQLNDFMVEKHGATAARALDIPSKDVLDFIETDIMKIVRTYLRTMAADISVARVFGDAKAGDIMNTLKYEGVSGRLEDEMNKKLDALLKYQDAEGNPYPKDVLEQKQLELAKFYEQARTDMHAVLERARGIRGAPQDPGGALERFLRTAMNLNVLRYMGGVTLQSIPDAARPVQAFGMQRAYRDGFMALMNNLKAVKMNYREAKLAGTALDVVLHSRIHQMSDIWDEFTHGTKLEKGIEFLTNKMGLVGLFDYWTAGMKGLTAHMTIVKLLDSIDLVLHGANAAHGGGSAKEIAEATEFLARSNLSTTHMEEIWKQVTEGRGGGKVNGTWVPQTAEWDITKPAVRDALRAFRAAVTDNVDRVIVTPGYERPLISDKSPMHKALFQFKSFGLSSTTKTMAAGLQESDSRYVQGVVMSLALGMLSYYTYAISAGGKAKEEMENATFAKWVDEAITRSGQTAVFDELSRILQRIPAASPYVTLSGQRSSRREEGDLVEALLGPTFDLLEKGAGVLTGVAHGNRDGLPELDPTQHTLHTARQILPFQNLFYLRQIFTAVEQAAGLPEKREPR